MEINRKVTIFSNQPSYKVFNKPIEHTDDTLFTFLNEVDADILKEEQGAQSQVFASYACTFTRSDPRTKELMRAVYDYTTDQLPYEFPNPQERYSTLSAAQQAACLKLLLAWQQNLAESEDDFIIWRVTNNKRCKEQQLVQKHIFDYANSQKERLYAPMKPLVLLYGKWFEQRMQHLMRSLPNDSYSTHSGLPQLAQCKSLNEDAASVTDVQLVCRRGQVRLWPEVALLQPQLSTLRLRLERYAYVGVRDKPASQLVVDAVVEQMIAAEEDVFVLPLEALLMLLTPGSYVDLPTEVLLHIRDAPDSEFRCIEFQDPMPARHCGWHTNSQLLTQAYAAYAPTQWMQFTEDGGLEPASNEEKTSAETGQNVSAQYKLLPIDEDPQDMTHAKANSALVSWRLSGVDPEQSIKIYTSLPIAAVRDVASSQVVGCHLIKLENKPDCGCEIMTKYELLSAWLQLKLNQTDVGHCSRVSLRDLAPMLEERLTLSGLEKNLHEYYHIDMAQVLCQLREFLKLLRSVTPGDYLLRYTDKYPDKFLLCQATPTPTSKSFKLHDLLSGPSLPNDINFLTDSNSYLPISPQLCSRLHEQLQLLPCSFPVKTGVRPRAKRKPMAKKQADFEAPAKLIQRTRKPKPKVKKAKRKNSRQRKRAAAKAQKEQDQELDKFMCL